MTTKSKTARLGQEAFFILQGEVLRTVVGKLSKEGYVFLDKRTEGKRHWFSYDRAVRVADDLLAARQETLRRELRLLTRRRKGLKKPSYQVRVMRTPLEVADLRETVLHSRTRILSKVFVPESYQRPGERVFVVVGPSLQTEDFHRYRPGDYFVLETEVLTVCLGVYGGLHYSLDSPFKWSEFFLSREAAADSLRGIAKLQSLDPVHFVSLEEFKSESIKIKTCSFLTS